MKWTYSLKNKITAALLLALVIIVTLLNNLVERHDFRELNASFASIYEDRMLVESYIFRIYENLQKREKLINDKNMSVDVVTELKSARIEREVLIQKYETTYLTEEEQVQFEKLKEFNRNINTLENSLLAKPYDDRTNLIDQNRDLTSAAFETLSKLSSIQTSEAQSIRKHSEKIISGNISFSQLEMGVLIVIGLIIQALIFSSKSLKPTKFQQPNLN